VIKTPLFFVSARTNKRHHHLEVQVDEKARVRGNIKFLK
jgi:hypothetical protein